MWYPGNPVEQTKADSAMVIVRVVRIQDDAPLSGAVVRFGAASSTEAKGNVGVRGFSTDSIGLVRARLHTGRNTMFVVRVGQATYADTISVRPGYEDTLRVSLGTSTICFT